MATIAAKVPDAVQRAFAARARKEGKTQSELLRELVQEYLAPPSAEWARAMLRFAERTKGTRRRRRPRDIDELTWAIDTTL